MDRADLIILLEKRIAKFMRSPINDVTVPYTGEGKRIKTVNVKRAEWAKCKDRFARWKLIGERL